LGEALPQQQPIQRETPPPQPSPRHPPPKQQPRPTSPSQDAPYTV
jgi:hypothetical protein